MVLPERTDDTWLETIGRMLTFRSKKLQAANLAPRCLQIHLQPYQSMILEGDFKGCSLSTLATETGQIFASCHTQHYYVEASGETIYKKSDEVKQVQPSLCFCISMHVLIFPILFLITCFDEGNGNMAEGYFNGPLWSKDNGTP